MVLYLRSRLSRVIICPLSMCVDQMSQLNKRTTFSDFNMVKTMVFNYMACTHTVSISVLIRTEHINQNFNINASS